MGLGSSRGCQGALMAKSYFSSCPGPKEPASSPAFPLSDLGYSCIKDSGLCDNSGVPLLPCISGEMEAENGPSPFQK